MPTFTPQIGSRVRLRTATTDSDDIGAVIGIATDSVLVEWPAGPRFYHSPDSLNVVGTGPETPSAVIRRCGSPLHLGNRDLPATAEHYYLRPASHGARAGEPYDVCRVCIRERDRRYRAARRNGSHTASPRAMRRASAAVDAIPAADVVRTSDRRFGVEIEYTTATGGSGAVVRELQARGLNAQAEGYNHRTPNHWKVTTDGSCGYELVSPPLSGDDGRDQVRRACEALRAAGARIDSSCGVHVHHDMAGYDGATIARALQSYAGSQVAINFLVDRSRRNNGMCRTVSTDDAYIRAAVASARRPSGLSSYSASMGYHARFRSINVRCYARQGTIEFRQHGATLSARKILAWVDFGQAMFAVAATGRTIAANRADYLIAQLAEHGGLSTDAATYLRNRAGAFLAREQSRTYAMAG